MSQLSQDGLALGDAREEMKSGREVVMLVVSQNGNALHFGCKAIKVDQEIVMTAVSQKCLQRDERRQPDSGDSRVPAWMWPGARQRRDEG